MSRRRMALSVLVLVACLAVAAIATAPGEPDGTPPRASPTPPSTPPSPAAGTVPVLGPAPPLNDLDGWLQADGITGLDDLRGSVVVVQFWTFGCSNCRATLPNLQALRDTHAERDDFAIVGVHHPEFADEEDPDAIAAAASELGVTWPIALDTDGTNFRTWQPGRRFWPRTFVVDRDGDIRFDKIGEGAYDELRATVDALLAADGPA